MKNSWILPVATLAVGAAGGYISGKSSAPEKAGSALEESAQRSRSTSRTDVASAASTRKVRGANTQEISRMPGTSTRIQALMDFYAGLSADQLAEEAGKLDGLPMNERIMASFLLFGRWAEVDPTAAMSFSNTMGFAGGFVRPTILQSWASTDPANAARYYEENPREFAMMGMMGGRGPMGGQGGASIIASEWARQDPEGAMAWAATLTTEKNQAMNSVIGEIAKTDPAKAITMLSQLEESQRSDAYDSIATQYGATDFAAAQTWIRSLPADDQAGALASAIEGLSNIDPRKAADELAKMADGDAKNRLIPDVIGDLAREDGQAAAELLKTQGDERAQRDGMRPLMSSWAAANPAAALEFANSFEPGRVRDSALQTWAFSNTQGNPADVVKVAESITDEGDRNRTVGMTAMRWMREDESAAKAYIESSTVLSDDAKQRLSEGGNFWGGRGNRGNRGGRGGN
jgi:hypothetical protein